MIVTERAVERTQPQGSFLVDHQGAHPLDEVLADGLLDFPGGRGEDGETCAVSAGVQQVFPGVIGQADDVPGADGLLVREGTEAGGGGIGEQAVQVGGGPQSAVPVEGEGHHGVVRKAGIRRREEGSAAVLPHAEDAAAVRADPEGSVGGVADDGRGAGVLLAVHAAEADGQVVEAVHGPGHHQDAGLVGTDPHVPLVVLRDGVDLPVGHVIGNPGHAGLAETVRLLVIDMQALRLGADDVGLVPGPLVRPVGQQRNGLAGAGARVAGRADAACGSLVDEQAAHRADEDVPIVGILGETADHDFLVKGDVRPAHRRTVHHRKAAGLSGQPDAAGGILEQAAHENGREIAAQEFAAVVLQGVRLRVQDIDPL